MKGKSRIIFFLMVICLATANFSFSVNKPDKVGVLILAHGGSEAWDKTVTEATRSLEKDYYVEIAFGMADPVTMQAGIDKLEKKRVDKIVVVPLFISSYSMIIRQNEYLLGLRDTLADPPMIMSHGAHGSMSMQADSHAAMGHAHGGGASHGSDTKMELPQLKIHAKILLSTPLDDHPIVAQIIYDRISELSQNPSNETVLIVAHGPNSEEDNKNWVKTIDHIADQVRTLEAQKGNRFKQIFSTTVRDDADHGIYEQAKENLRNLVYQSGKEGDVLVIPLLLSGGGVEKGFVKRLEGLKYKWNGKTLLPDSNITRFIQLSVQNALANQ